MKKFKNIVIILIMLVIMITLVGCENNTSNNSNKNMTSSKNTTTSSNNKTQTSNNTETKNNTNTAVDVTKYDFISAGKAQIAMPEKGETVAVFHIKNYGDIKVKFFNSVAPKAVENFITHAKKGYYNGVMFHRVINDFMIQGGDPTGTGYGGESIWNKNFVDEFDYSLVPYRGALCMANSGSNTNGSQFFIEQANYDEETYKLLQNAGYPNNLLEAYKIYGGSMHLFFVHTVFGQVIEGMDIVDNIAKTETDENYKPLNNVIIESIDILEY